jgi:DNA modification methylase
MDRERLMPAKSSVKTAENREKSVKNSLQNVKNVQKTAKKSSNFHDLNMDEWKQYEEISTDSLWLFNSRDKSGGHQLDYHGNCVPQILTQLLQRYTKKGDTMLDLFLGSGTSAIESERLERTCIGVELNSRMVDYVSDKLKDINPDNQQQVILGNSQDGVFTGGKIDQALKRLGKTKAQLAFLHPPYDDIIKFSEHQDDLSNQTTTEEFLDGFKNVCQLAFDKLEKGRFAAVVIGDKYAKGELVPLGFMCMQTMNEVGFKTKSIIVKNMTGNERGKGKAGNLLRYRALKGGFYLFKHEYVFVFQKP